MHISRKIRICFILLALVGILLTYAYLNSRYEDNLIRDRGQEGFLVRPVFAQTSGSTFLEEEAGMSIYIEGYYDDRLIKGKGGLQEYRKGDV